MGEDRDAALLSRFWRLHTAVQKRDGLEGRVRADTADRAVLDRSLAAAEDVMTARASLYHHLIDQGWQPPDTVVRDLAFDEIVLTATDGVLRA